MTNERIPNPIDKGTYHNSGMSYLWLAYKEHQRLILDKNELLETDTAERYACGFPIPPFQRELCWTNEQQIAFIESAWLGLPLGTFVHHGMDWHKNGCAKHFSGWLIDGQQRLTALQNYWEDKFTVFDLKFSELSKPEFRRFMGIQFSYYESFIWDEIKIRDLYNRLAFGGATHKVNERA